MAVFIFGDGVEVKFGGSIVLGDQTIVSGGVVHGDVVVGGKPQDRDENEGGE
ncbi:hypothetical protein PUR71_13400 [Streptomyces sp. SP17BM10]|uniref:hypothetical protein n=1 Tax=Streptomyces sp. SP17BM10 TaxID=3002530 RepID=UPI002E797A75|nr:hypothetical protein [Streptomyces sp. SP17BM10]MEE1783897.1 hypothetical protein [Streptomyces sp. SP17BM10]